METPTIHRLRLDGDDKPEPLDLSHHFSVVTQRRVPSELKRAYKFFQIPGILNIAGGLPHVDFFPFDTLEAQAAKPDRYVPSPNYPGEQSPAPPSSSPDPAAATHIAVPKTLEETDPLKKIDLATALQYGLAQGYPPLLSWVRQFTRENLHPDAPYRGGPEVVLTCGSTDGFAKTLNLFVDQWTEGINDISERPGLLCEPYVYSNILSQAEPYGVQVVPVATDPFGMAVKGPGGLEDVLANWDTSKGKRPNLMYTVTLGHNPTGIVLSVERKKEIYALCSKYDVIIVEDEPYWYLQFPSAAADEAHSRNQPPPPPSSSTSTTSRSSGYPFLDSLTPSFLTLDTDGRVVRLDTFSKTVAPGCRLGWITCQPPLAERFQRISEATTQQPSGFVQGLISELVLGASPHNARARSAFSRLLSPGEQATFSGWDTAGFIRWLEGLRGVYERRMARMCRVLDAGADLVSTARVSSTWSAVTKTPLYTYAWPRGGMFIWLRVRLEAHPLFGAANPGGNPRVPVLSGPILATALMVWLTTKPFRVLVAAGSMFAANGQIRIEEAWRYYRICFAAEAEENVDRAAERFVDGVHKFWEVRDARVIEKLLEEVAAVAAAAAGDVGALGGEEVTRLGWGMGC
ncbi:pyridoxal phosphate-dependent transferase [Staphylotrichum tortipilum]|uniref:Pyridoxal phosphate-dependent transferase n=1 Tax=Staphylotrichum tortipilum TaxID=2831512 RepID=A0AAN6MTZ7_9PEZI|nr:pyridoxal phosphate-dependent transferase [Staphylotrichum longicolle]